MELKLLETEDGRKTQIKVTKGQYPIYKSMISAYIALHGGSKIRENKTYLYFEVNADLMNSKK